MSQNNSSNKMGLPPDKAELTNLPLKLHALLEEAERLDQTYIVSWENQGTAFKVHDKKRFVDEIMPKYFSTSNYQSFQRNCNLWGFRTASKGPNKGQCSHPSFVRGDSVACRTMKVVRNKSYPLAASTPSSKSINAVSQPPLEAISIGTLPHSIVGKNTESNTAATVMGRTLSGIDARTILQQLLTKVTSATTQNVNNSTKNESHLSSLVSAFPGEGDRDLPFCHQMMPHQQNQQQLSLQPSREAVSALPSSANLQLNIPSQQAAPVQTPISSLLSLLCGASLSLSQQQQQQQRQCQANGASNSFLNTSSNNDESSDSNTRSSYGGDGGKEKFDPLIFKAKALREEALQRGSRILLCRARGMPTNHSANTAFFEVPANAVHGQELVCSHPICRQGRIKFVFCKYCDEPVAKRSFRINHDHKDLVEVESKLPSKRSGQTDDEVSEGKPRARKLQKVDARTSEMSRANALVNPLAALAAAAAAGVEMPQSVGGGVESFLMKSGYSDTSSFSASIEHRPSDGGYSNSSSTEDDQNDDAVVVPAGQEGGIDAAEQLKVEWCELLDARRAVETAEEMSAWLMRVFSVSQRCATGRNHNISDDDDMNNSDQSPGKESSVEQSNQNGK